MNNLSAVIQKNPPLVYLTCRKTFSAAHRLSSPHLSEKENQAIFMQDYYPHGHGHDYVLEVTIKGKPDAKTGMVFSLFELGTLIEKTIIQVVDHRFLNKDIPVFEHLNPTIENMAGVFWKWLTDALPKGLLWKIRIQETESYWVTYKGE